ncbi:uncharacterized protein LOC124686097 [Lolium rigidum]|uniref:uncharacterized protein LOC124686097 n=1 Tax=Lolium rigidum TaxID=89674 RepID=UPI001F5C65C7|nr:uncharacterized protein LOC124686097 [Lolium rigidum]
MASRRHCPSSPAANPLDDENLLCEILLRLPPQPSSLPRASAVCKRWRRLVSEAGFFRRFRLHHYRNPPLLGFFQDGSKGMTFVPTLEAPNRVHPRRFSLQRDGTDRSYMPLGCRHGLFLILLPERLQVLVWDPLTGDQNRIAVPAPFATSSANINGAVLRDAGNVQRFQVVLVLVDDGHNKQNVRALACVYSSNTGLWGDLLSTPIPYQAKLSSSWNDAVLAGDSLHWRLWGDLAGILEFDLEKQSLTVIGVPLDKKDCFRITRTEGGGLGFICISECSSQLWKRKTDSDGVTSWMLGRTVELDKLFSLKLRQNGSLIILGYAEENNVVLVWTISGLFMIHLESFKFKKLFETMTLSYYYPFESVFPAGK